MAGEIVIIGPGQVNQQYVKYADSINWTRAASSVVAPSVILTLPSIPNTVGTRVFLITATVITTSIWSQENYLAEIRVNNNIVGTIGNRDCHQNNSGFGPPANKVLTGSVLYTHAYTTNLSITLNNAGRQIELGTTTATNLTVLEL